MKQLPQARAAFPAPFLSLLIGVGWLSLNHSVAPAHLVAALVLAWGIPRLLTFLLPSAVQVASWRTAGRLLGVVLWDILVANLVVARLVLNPTRTPCPAWLRVPLAADHPQANALLASIITMTPGTVSVSRASGMLLVHMLDCADPAAAVDEIDRRYQQPLLLLFGLAPQERRP